MYIDNEIDNDYEEWTNGDVILLHAQTGKGKTYFILNTLLKYTIENDGYIFYFVNRKLLKKQIEEEIKNKEIELSQYKEISLSNYITVITYQYIENNKYHKEIEKEIVKMEEKYKKNLRKFYKVFFIYDECHYFYCDANFNTKTEISYYYLRNMIQNKYFYYNQVKPHRNEGNIDYYKEEKKCDYIEIFISATMEHIKNKITTNSKQEISLQNIFNFSRKCELYEYGYGNLDYSYINMKIIESENIVPDLIITSSEKWLIFIDNKNYGKKLLNILQDKKIDTSYIDADYDNDDDAKKTVNEITENSLSKKRVIISTSVIDNGVSIKDEELRNLIILVDNKETFMQMVGRIRINNNNDKVNLYICKKTKKDFEKRLKSLHKLNEFYNRYENDMIVERKCHPLKAINESSYTRHELIKQQSKLLNDILSCPETINYARKLCYSINGLLVISSFAVQRCRQLISFYTKIIKEFDLQGEYAFIYTVGEWLGKESPEIIEIIEKEQKTFAAARIKNIDKVLSEKLCMKNTIMISKDENINIKKNLLYDFIFVINNNTRNNIKCIYPTPNFNKILKNLVKNERPVCSDDFNIIMNLASLPYKLTTKRGEGYMLEKIRKVPKIRKKNKKIEN